MPYDLTPVEHDPFAAEQKDAGYKLTPVEHDPFAGQPAASPPQGRSPTVPLSDVTPDLSDPAARTAVERSYIGRIWDNFRSGFNEGAAGSIFNAKGREPDAPPDPIGFQREQVEFLQKHGLMRTGGEGPVDSVIKAADELFYYRGAQALDGFMRTGQGLFRGMQAAGLAAGLPRDIVAIPEAFQGNPGEVTGHDVVPTPIGPVRYGIERARQLGKQVEVTRLAPELEANPPPAPVARSAVRTGISEVDSVIASPTTTAAIDNAVIDRSHNVPYMAGGSVPLEDPTVYVDKHVPKEQTAPRASVERIIGSALKVGDKIYQGAHHTELLDVAAEEAGVTPEELWAQIEHKSDTFQYETSHGRVLPPEEIEKAGIRFPDEPKRASDTVTFDPAEPWTIHENVEQHVMELLIKGGMKPDEAYRVAHWRFAEPAEQAWYKAHDIDQVAAEKEQQTWLPKIQGENATDVPSNLYKKPYPHSDVGAAKGESVEEAQPSPDEVARAMDIIQRAPELKPELAQAGLQAAKDLGVIGPGKPPIDNLAPKEAAAAAIPGPKVTQEVGERMNPWQQRFEQFVSNLKAPDEVQNLIREAAKVNGDFAPARQGDIPLSHVESIAEAAGVEPGTVDPKGLGRLLKNDAEVRTAMQLMLQVTENLNEAARLARAEASPENLIALQEAIMRRDMAVEQVVGLRAEWGRTGKVFQEFLANVKDQEALGEFLKTKGRTPDDLKGIADAIAGLNSPGAIARFANDMRKPTFWDKYLFYWVNALISGPVTHLKYIGANGAFAAYEAGVVTPLAGAIGTARRAVTGSAEGVYLGEGPARVWGLLAGTPDALKAAYRAGKENIQVPLPGEVAKNINPVINQKPQPIGGPFGAVIGIPSRFAAGIHSFFNFLGYRAEIEAQAYRQATKEGLDGDAFWRRREEIANNPTDGMMNDAIDNGYRLTFISELGKWGKAVERLVNYRTGGAILPGGTQPLKLIMPFMHIPANLLKRGAEMTPVAPFIDSEMRADLMGTNGAVAQDTATARLVAGGVVSAMVANWAVNDTVTGYGPTDPNERALWLRTHEPYSVRIGNWWVSYNKFGPIGDLIGLTANLTDIGPKVAEGDYEHAAGNIVKATSRLLEDEVGMQGLVNLIDAVNDPDSKGKRFVSSLVASNMPYSSALRQIASFNDPYMREAKTFVDQLRYNTPWSRQDLLPKRDWLGAPMPNPGYATILRSAAVNADPIDLEIQRLQIKPSPPQDRIGGVKLTPRLYDEYQATTGPLTREMVGSMVESPGWQDLPDYVRETAIRHGIEAARKQGAAAMQMNHPELILDGLQQKIDHITGASHTARPKNPPADLVNPPTAEPQ